MKKISTLLLISSFFTSVSHSMDIQDPLNDYNLQEYLYLSQQQNHYDIFEKKDRLKITIPYGEFHLFHRPTESHIRIYSSLDEQIAKKYSILKNERMELIITINDREDKEKTLSQNNGIIFIVVPQFYSNVSLSLSGNAKVSIFGEFLPNLSCELCDRAILTTESLKSPKFYLNSQGSSLFFCDEMKSADAKIFQSGGAIKIKNADIKDVLELYVIDLQSTLGSDFISFAQKANLIPEKEDTNTLEIAGLKYEKMNPPLLQNEKREIGNKDSFDSFIDKSYGYMDDNITKFGQETSRFFDEIPSFLGMDFLESNAETKKKKTYSKWKAERQIEDYKNPIIDYTSPKIEFSFLETDTLISNLSGAALSIDDLVVIKAVFTLTKKGKLFIKKAGGDKMKIIASGWNGELSQTESTPVPKRQPSAKTRQGREERLPSCLNNNRQPDVDIYSTFFNTMEIYAEGNKSVRMRGTVKHARTSSDLFATIELEKCLKRISPCIYGRSNIKIHNPDSGMDLRIMNESAS